MSNGVLNAPMSQSISRSLRTNLSEVSAMTRHSSLKQIVTLDRRISPVDLRQIKCRAIWSSAAIPTSHGRLEADQCAWREKALARLSSGRTPAADRTLIAIWSSAMLVFNSGAGVPRRPGQAS
jgi:hypothetical protein